MPSRTEPIVRSVFRSGDLSEGERAATYGELVGGTGRMTPLATPFFAEFDAYVVGPLRLHEVRAVPHLFERSAGKIALDGVQQLLVQHLVRGRAEIEVEGDVVLAPEGSVFAVSFARPLTIRELGDMHLRMLTIGRRAAEAALGELEALHGRVVMDERAARYGRHLASIWPGLETLPRAEVPGLVDSTLNAFSEAFGAPRADGGIGSSPGLLRMQAYIEKNLGDRQLSPESVGEAQRISRTQLYAAFEAEGGIARYIWRRRLAHVSAALRDQNDRRSLSDLASDYGFSDQAQLAKQFKRAYGETASNVRRSRASGSSST
jgi:AraC-like DNA-binding protein